MLGTEPRTLCILGRNSWLWATSPTVHSRCCFLESCLQGVYECVKCVMPVSSHICSASSVDSCCFPWLHNAVAHSAVKGSLIFAPFEMIWAGKMHTYNDVVRLTSRLLKVVSHVWSRLEIPASTFLPVFNTVSVCSCCRLIGNTWDVEVIKVDCSFCGAHFRCLLTFPSGHVYSNFLHHCVVLPCSNWFAEFLILHYIH